MNTAWRRSRLHWNDAGWNFWAISGCGLGQDRAGRAPSTRHQRNQARRLDRHGHRAVIHGWTLVPRDNGTDAYFLLITGLLRSSGISTDRDLACGRRENSDGTATLNAGIPCDLRGDACLEDGPGLVSQRDRRRGAGVSPRSVLYAWPRPALAREARSVTRYRNLLRLEQDDFSSSHHPALPLVGA
jgi:hypothetical protein